MGHNRGQYIVLFLLLFWHSTQAQYRITRTKVAGWAALAVAGAADGSLEGYGFDDRKSLERKYDKDPYGFYGSMSWASVYNGRNPENGFKHPILKYTGAFDFYHTMDDVRKFGYISGGVVIGIGGNKINSKKWYYIIDFAAGFAISAATKSASMRWIRS